MPAFSDSPSTEPTCGTATHDIVILSLSFDDVKGFQLIAMLGQVDRMVSTAWRAWSWRFREVSVPQDLLGGRVNLCHHHTAGLNNRHTVDRSRQPVARPSGCRRLDERPRESTAC